MDGYQIIYWIKKNITIQHSMIREELVKEKLSLWSKKLSNSRSPKEPKGGLNGKHENMKIEAHRMVGRYVFDKRYKCELNFKMVKEGPLELEGSLLIQLFYWEEAKVSLGEERKWEWMTPIIGELLNVQR